MNILNKTFAIGGLALLFSCVSGGEETEDSAKNEQKQEVVNVYSHRYYDIDKKLFADFESLTGIKVNVKNDKADKLIQLLESEGVNSDADLLVTVDAGRLYYAAEKGLLQSVSSTTLEDQVPIYLREESGKWYGVTKRARVVAYAKDRIKAEDLSTYENLTDAKWKGKISVRSSSNIYNQSLLASIIATKGSEEAESWAKGIVQNMFQEPKGNDRDQIKNVALGKADLAIVNTYYYGKLLNSSNELEKEAASKVTLYFPNQSDRGTHINISGIGVTAHAKNKQNAIKLIEFLTSEKAQMLYAQSNYEYPVNPKVEPSELLKSWGDFKEDELSLSKLGHYNAEAVEVFKKADWK